MLKTLPFISKNVIRNIFLFIASFLLNTFYGIAPNNTVTGKVSSLDGDGPLAGVSIVNTEGTESRTTIRR